MGLILAGSDGDAALALFPSAVSLRPRSGCSAPLCVPPILELNGKPGLIRANYGPLLVDLP